MTILDRVSYFFLLTTDRAATKSVNSGQNREFYFQSEEKKYILKNQGSFRVTIF